jgi:hypothetical protein
MKMPQEFSFQFVTRNEEIPIAELAVTLILRARSKNDYYFGPQLSNDKGIVSFQRIQIARHIEEAKKLFVMDYQSSIEECLPKMTVEVLGPQEIENLIRFHRERKKIYSSFPKFTTEFLNMLAVSSSMNPKNQRFDLLDSELAHSPKVFVL